MQTSSRKLVKELPTWFNYLRKDSIITARDVAPLFGYTVAGLLSAVQQGRFPKPDKSLKGIGQDNVSTFNSKRVYWSKKVVLGEFIRQRLEIANATSSD